MYKLYIHSGSENHGCEAIVRTTIDILKRPIVLFSRKPELDKKYDIDELCTIEVDEFNEIKKGTFKWFISKVQTKVSGRITFNIKYQYRKLISSVNKGDIYLSIGGDNYCYPGTEVLAAINYNLKKKGAKLVLWGCSVEPTLTKQKHVANDLKQFDLITARESISFEALKKINKNTILVSDPAFLLEKELKPLPENWNKDNMVGINASPLILQNGKDCDTVYNAYKMLIEDILKNTTYGIALIPHVVCAENNDFKVLSQLYEEYKDSNRIVLIEDDNCKAIKGYISRCRFFVGARTHATIAAYSSCVPTLVLGYSVKSKGIAKDIFGTYQNYVLPVQSLDNPQIFVDHFNWLVSHENEIKEHLNAVMPNYISRAHLGKGEIEKLV